MFKLICDKCNEFGFIFMPNLFVADLQQSIHNSVYEMILYVK